MQEPDPLREARVLEEYWTLQQDPILRGEGVVHGANSGVLLIPGLFGNDFYMATARNWLQRIGYRPIASSINWNVGCPRRLMDQVAQVPELQGGEPLAIVGHSRGGMLAKALCARLGDRVSHLILAGSPVGGMLAAGRHGMQAYVNAMQGGDERSPRGWMFRTSRALTKLLDPECETPLCDCEYMQALFAPLAASTRVTSIYSPTDAVVPATSSVIPGAQNIEVQGSHGGLMFNVEVYRHIAAALAS